MLRASEKRFIQKTVFGKIGLVALVVLFAVFANGTWSVYKKASFSKENRQMAEQELAELHERSAALEEELARLDTERGVEEEIRQKYDVGREGEKLIVLVDAPEPKVVVPVLEPTIWEKLVRFLGFR